MSSLIGPNPDKAYTDGFVDNCNNSSALAMELLQFYIKPFI